MKSSFLADVEMTFRQRTWRLREFSTVLDEERMSIRSAVVDRCWFAVKAERHTNISPPSEYRDHPT